MTAETGATDGDAAKFAFNKISSGFEGEAAAAAPAAEAVEAAPAGGEAEAASDAIQAADTAGLTEDEKKDKVLDELRRAAARAKRFGGDASDIEKLISRAERFGVDAIRSSSGAGLGSLDKPLAENSERPPSTRGRGGMRGGGMRGGGMRGRHMGVYKNPRYGRTYAVPNFEKNMGPPENRSEEDKAKLLEREKRFKSK
ncbi:uncharacterized protein V1510DRAFT_400964 [Dipodascopsis tothii]|uniref:uncharacterized protein n=1 Tax=Dipodascopsis tothii TaxID=44089 RepID=UPI0034CFEA24